MRELTTEELEVERAEVLPAREPMGAGATFPGGRVPVASWSNPASHEMWQPVGPHF